MQRLIPFCLFLLLTLSTTAEAKWWIFGQSQDEVVTRYIYLNDIAYDELGKEVTLYRDMLPAGRVVIKGRGQSGKNRIGAAEISLDGGKEWQRASLARDGSFELSFVPEINREYDLALKLLDTAGKSNDIEVTRKKITVSDRDIQGIVHEALDAMITAYQSKNARDFMKYVDPDFAGDPVILESAILKDFTILEQIELRYTLNSLVSGSGGKIFTSISYNRQVVIARTGEVLKDNGQTEFTFNLTGDSARVYSMKNPLIFGLSEKEDVGTGDVNTDGNDNTLQIPTDGGLPFVGDQEGGGAAPTPQNFARTFFSYPELTLTFTVPAGVSSTNYRRILEWRYPSGGVWTVDNEFEPLLGEVSFSEFTVHCRGEIWDEGSILYRISLENIATGERSGYSNVITVP